MKKIFSLFMLSGLVLIASCENDDDNFAPTDPIAGTWNLISVSGGIMGSTFDFPAESIKWTFNTTSHTVIVVNNNPADSPAEDFFSSGTYNYLYPQNNATPQNCNTTLRISTTDLGCREVSGHTMILTQVQSDGYVLTFSKEPLNSI